MGSGTEGLEADINIMKAEIETKRELELSREIDVSINNAFNQEI